MISMIHIIHVYIVGCICRHLTISTEFLTIIYPVDLHPLLKPDILENTIWVNFNTQFLRFAQSVEKVNNKSNTV